MVSNKRDERLEVIPDLSLFGFPRRNKVRVCQTVRAKIKKFRHAQLDLLVFYQAIQCIGIVQQKPCGVLTCGFNEVTNV